MTISLQMRNHLFHLQERRYRLYLNYTGTVFKPVLIRTSLAQDIQREYSGTLLIRTPMGHPTVSMLTERPY